MSWRMRLSEFDIDAWYKKGLLSMHAVPFSCLRSSRPTSVPVDADIPTYSPPSNATSKNCHGKDDLGAELALTTDISQSIVFITLKEVRVSQEDAAFRSTLCAHLAKTKKVFFRL